MLFVDIFALILIDSPLFPLNYILINRFGDQIRGKIDLASLGQIRNTRSISGKIKTCFKNPEKPSCIDLFLTNFPCSFQNTTAICTENMMILKKLT